MLTYIIKAILFSAMLMAIYHLFLEREKMHRFKRFYLLISIILPFAVPLVPLPTISLMPQIPGLINITDTGPVTNMISENFTPANNISKNNPAVSELQTTLKKPASTPTNQYNSGLMLLLIGYITVTLALLYRFIRNVLSIHLTIKNNKSIPYLDGTIVLTKNNGIPHSFLSYIFVNQDDFERGKIEKEILAHELTHVKQYHSLDILFAELITVFAWINPILFFCRKAIRLNHEFLADQSVIESVSDTKAYQLLLFEKIRQTNSLSLSSPFNYLLTKKRLKMMSKKASPGIAFFKQIAIIPLIAVAGLLFTAKGCNDDLTGPLDKQQANNVLSDESYWKLVSRTNGSGSVIKEIIGEFDGTMADNDVLDAPIKVKIFVTKRKDGEMFTEFYESGSETPVNMHKSGNKAFSYTTQSFLPVKVSLNSGETIEMGQTAGGSHMWDHYTKTVPPPPDAPEGLKFGEPRMGDFLKLILEQNSRMSIMVDFRSVEEFNNKIYRFDIDPAGLKELFAKL